MIADEPGMHLHDRFTRGEALTDEERAQLEARYEAQDRAEAEELGLNVPWRRHLEPMPMLSSIDIISSKGATRSSYLERRSEQTSSQTLARGAPTVHDR